MTGDLFHQCVDIINTLRDVPLSLLTVQDMYDLTRMQHGTEHLEALRQPRDRVAPVAAK